MPLLVNGYAAVFRTCADNADVFVMPDGLWNIVYTQEEISKFARALQQRVGPHLRHSNDHTDAELEWGQAMMMWLTVAIQFNIDVDKALRKALYRVYDQSAEKRTELNLAARQN